MPNLPRVTQQVFGSAAGANQIAKFGSLFAGSPETTTDPALVQQYSNFLTGWFAAAIGGNSPAIEDMNALFFLGFHQLAYILQKGIPAWDANTEYFTGDTVQVLGVQYVSKTDGNLNNAVSNTTHWRPQSTVPVGSGQDYWGGGAAPAGWVYASGRTIGSAASGATERANADTFDLFSLLWTNYSDALLPIFDSGGSPSTRGASALADFNANKRLTLIDKRGRVSVGKDDMGGTSAGRMTTAGSGVDGLTLGASGGTQTHVLTVPQMPSHSHGGVTGNTNIDHSHTTLISYSALAGGPFGAFVTVGAGGVSQASVVGTQGVTSGGMSANANHTHPISGEGGGGAHQNTQPSIVCNYILKL